MNMLRWIGLALLAGGCGSESNPGQIGFAPASDATITTTSNDAGDDPEIGVDPTDMAFISDMSHASDMQIDANSDASLIDAADATADMADMAEICWGERTGLTAGFSCGDTATTGPCNLVTQAGCLDQKYCTFVFNGSGLVAACTSIVAQCGFLKFDDVCVERVGQTVQPLGTCEPGSYCPGLAPAETQALCARYCELKTGLGCSVEEVCVQIVSGQSAQSLAGYGECSATEVCSL